MFLLNGSKSLANTFAFRCSSSQLLGQPHARTGMRRGSAGGGLLFHAPAAPGREKGFAFLPFPSAGGIPGAVWERNPGHCWNREGDGAHSFTTLWAGLALAGLLLNPLSHRLFLCWILFSPVLVSTGSNVTSKLQLGCSPLHQAYASQLPWPHYLVHPCNALQVCPA